MKQVFFGVMAFLAGVVAAAAAFAFNEVARAPAAVPVQAEVVYRPNYGTPEVMTGQLQVMEYGGTPLTLYVEFGGDGIFRNGFDL